MGFGLGLGLGLGIGLRMTVWEHLRTIAQMSYRLASGRVCMVTKGRCEVTCLTAAHSVGIASVQCEGDRYAKDAAVRG